MFYHPTTTQPPPSTTPRFHDLRLNLAVCVVVEDSTPRTMAILSKSETIAPGKPGEMSGRSVEVPEGRPALMSDI